MMIRLRNILASALILGFGLLAPAPASAHCDTLKGPVVASAKLALETGDVTPALKWVKKEHEAEIRAAFAHALKVRALGAEAKDLADNYFFETLVRVHRAGEGAPYTGLSAQDPEPAIAAADKALESGSVDELARMIAGDVATGIRQRFARAQETRKHADESVEAGREYVEAYVLFTHFVERLHLDAAGSVGHNPKMEAAQAEAAHRDQ